MHVHTVVIERVFDMQRHPNNGKYSEFSIQIEGKRYYGVRIGGWPELTSGVTITALLVRRGNWKTLAGWINRTTGEIVAPDHVSPLVMGVVALLGFLVCLFLATTAPTPPTSALVMMGIWLGPILSGAMSLSLLAQGGFRLRTLLALRALAGES